MDDRGKRGTQMTRMQRIIADTNKRVVVIRVDGVRNQSRIVR